MTLLSIIQDVSAEVGVPVPSSIATNRDQTVVQMMRLVNSCGTELMKRHAFQALVSEATFSTVAVEDQGAIQTLAPGVDRIINGTLFNRSRNWEIMGPLLPDEWQSGKSMGVERIREACRIRGGHFLLMPVPPAGETIAFEYVSGLWALSATGTAKEKFSADSDTARIPERLITLNAVWRWLQIKGLDYGEAFRLFQQELTDAVGHDSPRRTMCLDGFRGRRGGITAPEGSWVI